MKKPTTCQDAEDNKLQYGPLYMEYLYHNLSSQALVVIEKG